MLENERLISTMTLEQKLRLITSSKLYRSSPVGKYEFPVLRFRRKPFQGSADTVLTQYPADRTLASSWNTELIRKVFAFSGEEARKYNVFDGYFSCNDPKKQDVSSSHYLTAQYLAARGKGLAGNQPTAHQYVTSSFTEKYLRRGLTDTILEECPPDVLVVDNAAEAEFYLKNQQYEGLVYGIATTPDEVARYFFSGCSFVFLKEDIFKDLVPYFEDRTRDYRMVYSEYRENKLKLKDIDRRSRELKIFDEGLIDLACDRMIDYLKKQKSREVQEPQERDEATDKKRRATLAEHAALAREAARESIVLLKNDHILPLKKDSSVALIGEYVSNFDFQRETFPCAPTRSRLPVEIVRDYDLINVIGYADGYRKGEEMEEELYTNAARLSSAADYTVIFLSANPGENVFPESQTKLVKMLLNWKKKIILVASADRCPDMSFAKGCQAILYTGRGGQEVASAVFDLITGEYSPSGHLTEEVSGSELNFPLGFGLTYTNFEYRDLKIDEGGVSCLVENKGDCDAYATVQLYLQMEKSVYEDKTLKGFSKVFVAKGDVVRVTIPFTENTFRYYDDTKNKYRVKGGEYKIYISESRAADKISGTVKIAADEGAIFKNTVAESSADGDKIAFSETRGLKEREGMSYGMKMFLSVSFLVYFTALALLLMLASFVPVDHDTLFYAISGSVTGVVDILVIVYIVIISLKHKKEYIPVNDVLSDMVDKVEDFVEVAKLTYRDPIKEKKEAEAKAKEEEQKKAKEEAEKAAKEKAEKEKAEKAKAEAEAKAKEEAEKKEQEESEQDPSMPKEEPSIDKPSDYPEAESFEEMCTSFRKYLLSCGINMEIASSRRFLAAIAATRLVIVSSKNSELLPEFERAINRYFGGMGILRAENNWNTVEDLLWQEDGGRSIFSVFTNTVNDASKRRNKNAVALIDNVDSINLHDWFSDVVEFALSPSEKHILELNADTKVKLPRNLCCLLFMKENGLAAELPRAIVNASVQIEIAIRRVESVGSPQSAEGQGKAVSYPNFNALMREAKENYFLAEQNWARLDHLFELIQAEERVVFGNKNTLQAERFTSVLMACGGEESEALDSLFLCKLVPFLKTTKLYARPDGITLFSDYFQKSFPEADLSGVQRALAERPKKAEDHMRDTLFTQEQRAQTQYTESVQAEPVQAERPVGETPQPQTAYEPVKETPQVNYTTDSVMGSAPREEPATNDTTNPAAPSGADKQAGVDGAMSYEEARRRFEESILGGN